MGVMGRCSHPVGTATNSKGSKKLVVKQGRHDRCALWSRLVQHRLDSPDPQTLCGPRGLNNHQYHETSVPFLNGQMLLASSAVFSPNDKKHHLPRASVVENRRGGLPNSFERAVMERGCWLRRLSNPCKSFRLCPLVRIFTESRLNWKNSMLPRCRFDHLLALTNAFLSSKNMTPLRALSCD